MFKIKQHIEVDENYNIIYVSETINGVIMFWERFYYKNGKIIYSEDSENYKYLFKNGVKVNKETIEFYNPYSSDFFDESDNLIFRNIKLTLLNN